MDLEFHQLDLRYEALRVRRPDRERRLLSSLAERGQQVAIVVIRLREEPNQFLVIDGYKRIRAPQRLGLDTVRATVWDMDETEALILDRSLRTAEGETALEQGWLLSELHTSFGLNLEELARRFDRSVSWVSRRLALVRELPKSVQEYVRLGKIGAHAAMKYLVPMARAKPYDCERLAEQIAHHQFTTEEVGLLYAAWRSQPFLRARVIDDPKLFLRARREIEEEAPEAASLDEEDDIVEQRHDVLQLVTEAVRAGEEMLRNLDMAATIARRASRQWREAAGAMNDAERENAWLCVQQAIKDLTRLSDTMEKENSYVESEPAGGNPGTSSQGCGEAPDCTSTAGITHGGQESDPVAIGRAAADRSAGEGRAAPPGNPRSLCLLPGEPRAGP